MITSFLKNHWKKILIILIVVGGIGFLRYKKAQNNKIELVFEKPVFQNLTKILEVSGIIDAKEKANLRFSAGGKVVYLGAKEGDYVKKWQTIATIDQRTLQKQLQQNLNTYMKERWDFDDTTEDYDYDVETLDTRRSLDKTQWDLNNEVLDVEIYNIAITNTVLYAPFAGILVSSPTNVTGVNLLATESFEIVNPDTLVFKAAVDEADIAQVALEQKSNIFLDSYPDDPIASQVNYVAFKSSASSTGTVFVIEFPITGKDLLNKYRLGMNGDVEIILDTRENILTIPFEATRERDDKVFVDVRTQNDEYEEREIKIGLETEDYVEVLGGLSENDEVLIPEN
ncbi:efflux RND transporter periplasmic adaptor subunit [Patescibacteria group bacterium]|nr:efflux RND transporter periplasmic adaptor subunit [Patescibacteria group bacterium]MBU1885578.1 efflux RND transporter periplasmic adaptor subunit [Patescibacteria group bacterium]